MKYSYNFSSQDLVSMRLDIYLAECPEIHSRNIAQKIIKSGLTLVNGTAETSPKTRVHAGDCIEFTVPQAPVASLKPIEYPLEIHYEDEHLLVLHKDSGVVVHPAPGHWKDTLVNYVLAHTKIQNRDCGERPGIVHRLDKETSGLLVIAKTKETLSKLSEMFAERKVNRVYDVIVQGKVKSKIGEIDKNLGRSVSDRKKQAVREDGRRAITRWKSVKTFRRFSYIECKPETGRTHQIRVHMMSIGHPIAGDSNYGHPDKNLEDSLKTVYEKMGMGLHARELIFAHPITGEQMAFRREMPERMGEFLTAMEKSATM